MSPVSVNEVVHGIPVEPASMRSAMARFATGVIVLSVGGENIHGMTANAFTSVSLEPPKILCCVAHSAVMHKAITSVHGFGVSILGAGQEPVARHFADKARPLGPEQFHGFGFEPGARTGAPLLHGAVGWLECELSEAYDSGDHSIFIGDVVHAATAQDSSGLLFFNGGFRQLGAAPE
ncbi:flavin reductase family protein [Streptomyces venetus]|uniref:flavin reductase family protein n=1 Tax=Streptomyces venetus TaxID=1701086 RepID=UPI003C2D431F